jgi:hypothetical protein
MCVYAGRGPEQKWIEPTFQLEITRKGDRLLQCRFCLIRISRMQMQRERKPNEPFFRMSVNGPQEQQRRGCAWPKDWNRLKLSDDPKRPPMGVLTSI